MKRTRLLTLLGLTTALALVATGCGAKKDTASGDVRKVTVAVAPGFFPITYADDDGNAVGYDVDVFKALDEILPQYEFEFEIADKETMNVGVQTGTYQVGINSLFKTDERKETYYLPENNMGYTPVGIIQREDENITSLEDAFDGNLNPYPVMAAGGIRLVYQRYNDAHPDKAIDFVFTTEFSYADLFASIQSGDYDFTPDLIPVYNLQKPETVAGLKISEPIDVIPTYPIINKSETELGDAINEGLKTLKENGTLSKLSTDTFGYDVFALSNE